MVGEGYPNDFLSNSIDPEMLYASEKFSTSYVGKYFLALVFSRPFSFLFFLHLYAINLVPAGRAI